MNRIRYKNDYVLCDLCGSDKYEFLFDGKDRLHGKEGRFSYVMCVKCGLVYMNPQISSEELMNFYPNDYAPYRSISCESEKIEATKHINKRGSLPTSVWQNLSTSSNVLDVGCGNGRFLNKIRSTIPSIMMKKLKS